MSRLPRLPDSSKLAQNNFNFPMKRQHDGDGDEEADQPRKLPAIGPLRELRGKSNLAIGPPPLTKPRPTELSKPRIPRATSAPPKSTSNITTTRPRLIPSRPPSTTTNPSLTDLQNKISSIESARQADAAALSLSMASERAKVSQLQSNHLALSRELAHAREAELAQRRERGVVQGEIEKVRKQYEGVVGELEGEVRRWEREGGRLEREVERMKAELEREKETAASLRSTLTDQANVHQTLSTQTTLLKSQIQSLQSSLQTDSTTLSSLSLALTNANARIQALQDEAREAEGVRRRLHNMVQELKGNIRVFCRVRPVLRGEEEEEAEIRYPDKRDRREIVVESTSESAMGQERKEVHNFGFDRVFEPSSTQEEVFEEISQLAQSCTDGYNVCIFAYGQTGSGKSFTMEGGGTEETAGMIPRAVQQVFRVTDELKSQGWEYKMEGQFLEIYNETINDLLGKHEFDQKKHEIKHDPKTLRTTITDTQTHPLTSPTQVTALLNLAQSRRKVAATLMNGRSSRSHSVFVLRISGVNMNGEGERREGSLNLVDLAGSERLVSSGVGAGGDKERLRETQNINRSLSALGDVIGALGEKGEKGDRCHVPYRNSKLTYLLQNSLSGNSKTLMVLNLSPLAAHLNESLTSLRFATKVNNTTIGTAKKGRLTG